MNADNTILEIKGLNKYFGLTHANKDIFFSLKKGEIRGLAGENGSGKSTLLSQIAGINIKDSGEMIVNGEDYNPQNPLDANVRGISIVVQELGVVNNLPAGVNIFLGRTRQFSKWGIVSLKKLFRAANEQFAKWNLEPLLFRQLADHLTVEETKMVELARALSVDPEILLLDEITQSLSYNNRNKLYGLIKKYKSMGRSVILITHDIEEMIRITDSITVLRDGEIVGTEQSDEVTPDRIKTMMVGRKISGEYYRDDMSASYEDEVVLDVKNVTVANEIEDISFELHKGEILGFCGLSDSGIHTIGKALFGLVPLSSGTVNLRIKNVNITNQEIALRNGMAYVPKDREREALMIQASILENLCLPSLDELKERFGYLRPSKLKELAKKTSEMFEVKSTGISQRLSGLSGGNKQKINLGRWLIKDLNVLILDCPTRGVDIGVKAFIYSLMREAKKRGLATVLISDELTEVLGMADRLIVMKNGKVSGVINRGKEFTEESVIGVMV